MYMNIKTDIFKIFIFLPASICPLYYAYVDIEGKTLKNHVNYVIRICQHIIDKVSYLGAAIYYKQTKLNIIQGEILNVGDNAYFLSEPEYVCLQSVNEVDDIC